MDQVALMGVLKTTIAVSLSDSQRNNARRAYIRIEL
jgi:hypothetical protein